MDDFWWDNVSPLIHALQDLGLDPVAWAADHDFSVFYDSGCMANGWHPRLRGGPDKDQIHFACGYMQATGNLTNATWAEQMDQALADADADDDMRAERVKATRLYEDLAGQAKSLRKLGIEGHRLVAVLGHEEARLLGAWGRVERTEDGDHVHGMPIHVGPHACCAVVSVEAQQ